MVSYGFDRLNLEKLEASIFIGNLASQRIFLKNGFYLERIIPHALDKHGLPVGEWLFGLPRTEYDRWQSLILHLCPQSAWQEALTSGAYHPASLETEGFIHCSRPPQILDVANRYFLGAKDLILLWIEKKDLLPEVRWEPSGGDDFPHVYGAINLEAVSAAVPVPCEEDGRFVKFPRR
jgi:uncharacterized protein (DUF952 family)